MGKEKFVFEWKVGDEVICPRRWVGDVVSLKGIKAALEGCRPHGHTRKRYKAEKLAWQQSRMKEGDWVKRMKNHWVPELGQDFNGKPFQLGMSSGVGTCKGLGADYHAVQYLKPCKPPKEKVSKVFFKTHTFNNLGVSADELRESVEQIRSQLNGPKTALESDNFKIEDGRLIFTAHGYSADWGSVSTQKYGGNYYYQPSCVDDDEALGCGFCDSNRLREIANLLDRSMTKSRG